MAVKHNEALESEKSIGVKCALRAHDDRVESLEEGGELVSINDTGASKFGFDGGMSIQHA